MKEAFTGNRQVLGHFSSGNRSATNRTQFEASARRSWKRRWLQRRSSVKPPIRKNRTEPGTLKDFESHSIMIEDPDCDKLPIHLEKRLSKHPRRILDGIAIERTACRPQPMNPCVIGVKVQGIEIVWFDPEQKQRISAA